MYLYKKKSYVIAIFLRDIDKVLQKEQKQKSCLFCCIKENKIIKMMRVNLLVKTFLYKHKIPNFIDELLQIYRNRNNLTIDQLKKNYRYNDLFMILKYIDNYDNYDKNNKLENNDRLREMTQENKLNIIKKIIKDIEII
jgi:CTP synthase (UTP-ammonia lyase)